MKLKTHCAAGVVIYRHFLPAVAAQLDHPTPRSDDMKQRVSSLQLMDQSTLFS